MIFSTYRLHIRKALPTEEDIELFYRLWTDGRVMANVGFPNGISISRDELRQRLELQSETEFDQFLIVERKSDGQRLGECKLGKPDEQGIAETDIKLLPEFWGHSYGVEVKRGLLEYLFTHTDCKAVHATPNVNNRPSIRMQEAVGGKRIGEAVYEFPETMHEFTTPVHHYTYEVTRQTWEAQPREANSNNINIQIKPAHELTPDEQKRISDLLLRVFIDDPFRDMFYAKVEWNILVYIGDILASNVDIVQRTIMVGGLPFHVGGISGVATLPEFRGRGLATRAVSAATRFIKDELRLEYCLLTTGLHRKTFYEGLGWQTISEPAYFDQPSGKVRNGGLTMVLALSDKPWPPGEIDLCGLPW